MIRWNILLVGISAVAFSMGAAFSQVNRHTSHTTTASSRPVREQAVGIKAPAVRSVEPSRLEDLFALEGRANILDERHFGIINGFITSGIPYRQVTSIGGLYAPPYASSNFTLEVWLFGEKVQTQKYKWLPIEVERSGTLKGIHVSSSTVLVARKRAVILRLTLQNTTAKKQIIPLQLNILGSLDYVQTWDFSRPNTNKKVTEAIGSASRVIRQNDTGALVVGTDIKGLQWENWSSHWVTHVTLSAGEQETHYVVVAMGDKQQAMDACNVVLKSPEEVIAGSRQEFTQQVQDLFAKLPRLEASDKRLETFYNRSLLHFLLNKWRVPEFVLQPYYGTGSVLGGCLANYLWDFGGPWELFPLYDPKASKEHIKQFLKIDLTSHYSFDPMTGRALGPFYPVNQEKIIFLVYYYVLHTGDVQFLEETVRGKTVLDWIIFHAMFGDDLSKPVALIDYGDGNHHLELRGKYKYSNYVPDLNGRRYANYVLANELAKRAGEDHTYLLERAASLKALLKRTLWSPKHKWYFLMNNTGVKDLRYSIQMFKLISSDVLGKEEEEGLLSHLNESEFLSAYGLHSMSKKDIAYDQVDFDNGGGGSFNAFPPQIAERLYKAGYPDRAEDILKRVLWWGERVPYWSDSFAANHIEYRKDTPLQSTFDATAAAQCVIFGMFGVAVKANGDILVDPKPPKFSPAISLKGVRIRGLTFDVTVDASNYEVSIGGRTIRSRIGKPVLLKARNGRRVE